MTNTAVQASKYQTIAVLVENKAGVLARVADLFARRGYNIISLTVAPTRDDRFSRITIVVDVESSPLEQVTNQLFKLINVVEIAELDPEQAIERELLIATVSVSEDQRDEFNQLIEQYYGKVLSVQDDQLTVSVESSPGEVEEFELSLGSFSVVYLQRSGRISLPKIGRSVPRHRIAD